MKRLVYRPKIWAYVKTDKQAIDLSPYIVSGTVDRVIGDVSTASLVLRNPDFKFTTPGDPAFHPMDPITIYMARNIDYPVRVFTGFLDTTPYLQLFPGTISLEASCTMKKLKYTYWDPALPFTQVFLSKFGWQRVDDGTARNVSMDDKTTKTITKRQAKSGADMNDSGFHNILYGVLEAAGGWKEEDIFIEALPSGIVDTVTKVFQSFKQENEDTQAALKEFLKNAIGETAAGASASGSSGPDSNAPPPGTGWRKIVATVFGNGGLPAKYGTAPSTFHDPNTDSATANGMGYRGPLTPWCYGEIGNSTLGGKNPGWKYLLYANGKQVVIEKRDRNDSDPGDGRVMDIWIHTASYLYPNAKTYSDLDNLPNSVAHGMEVYIKDIPQNTPLGPYSGDGSNNAPKSGARTTPAPSGSANEGLQHGGPPAHKSSVRVASTSIDDIVGRDIVDAATTVIESSIPVVRSSRKTVTARTSTDSNPIGNGDNGGLPSPGSNPSQPGYVPSPGYVPHPSGAQTDHSGRRAAAAGTTANKTSLKELANSILTFEGKGLSFPLANDCKQNLVDTRDTGTCKTSARADVGVTTVTLSEDMLKAILELLQGGTPLPINCLANGDHADGVSNHYKGNAIDVDASLGPGSANERKMYQVFEKHGGANNGETGGDSGKHWHFDFTGGGGGGAATGGGGSSGGGVSIESAQGIATAAAFSSVIEVPSTYEQMEAIGLQGQKSYLNDKPLIEFIDQLCGACMRSYMSLPDGRFYAFFPDHFGTFHPGRPPYWQIDDVELLEGSMSLSDTDLKTHVYVVGDTNYNTVQDIDDLTTSSGVVTIFNAFETNWLLSQEGSKGKAALFKDANKFMSRYGVRPDFAPEPLIRSRFFEAFSAFQRFMLLWSRQFLTQFRFTFMPELYPGGRVAFKDHDLVCYVDSVQHNFSYTEGFETNASLSAPSALDTNNDGMMEKFTYGMVKSF